jgi:hypothetical protein
MWKYIALLAGYAVLFGVLSYAYFTFSHRKRNSRKTNQGQADAPATPALT